MNEQTLEHYLATNTDTIINDKLFPVIKERCVTKERTPQQMRSAADLIERIARQSGLTNTHILQTANSYPAVYGEIRSPFPDAPTILIQGHYDVQPSDEKAWTKTLPHEPKILSGENGERRVYGRGASDDWGQVLSHLSAVEAYAKTNTPLPVNIKFLIEGGEEDGSTDMDKLLTEHKDLLRSDVVIITDSAPGRDGHKVITTTARGIVKVNITLQTGTNPPHSGDNIARNAVATLSYLLTSLKDYETQHILIPGFYDDVYLPTATERAKLNAMPFDQELFKKTNGLEEIVLEEGFTAQETMWTRPSYELHTIEGGERVNNIPITAKSYLTMRIVPHQTPEKAFKRFADALSHKLERLRIPKHQLSVKKISSSYYFATATDHPFFRAREEALQQAFGSSVDYMGCGGSEPIAVHYQQIFGVPVILDAINDPKDHYHGHNESLSIENGFIPGVKANVLFYEKVAALKKNKNQMKNLEAILKNATVSEQELVKLAHLYPTSPTAILRDHANASLLSLASFGGITLGGGTLFALTDSPLSYASVIVSILSGIKTLMAADALRENRKARASYSQDHEIWSAALPPTDHGLFFHYKNHFTYAPTPVEAILGERVYPYEHRALAGDSSEHILFFGRAHITEAKRESYTINQTIEGGDRPGFYKEKRERAHVIFTRDNETLTFDIDCKAGNLPEGIELLHQGDYGSFLLRMHGDKLHKVQAVYPILDDNLLTQSTSYTPTTIATEVPTYDNFIPPIDPPWGR